jgi:hypothetical protein
MERVAIREGKTPIILFAPHGFDGDDERTSIMVECMADTLDCYAVINRGWERGPTVDCFKDKADCNNVEHCHEDVVQEEIMEPILRFQKRIMRTQNVAYFFPIHGMSNKHRKSSGIHNLDVVVGHGAGSPNSLTCDEWRKDYMLHLIEEAGLTPVEGKKGGPMSGWARNNMNQLFRKWYHNQSVQGMQLEIIHDLRSDNEIASLASEYLAAAMQELISAKGFSSMKTYPTY